MRDRIRIAILGCGTITRIEHLPAVLAHADVHLVALVDADAQRAHALAQNHGVDCFIATDYRPVLNQVDAVINALPNSLHAPSTLDALRAGVHVLCEKPLATTAQDAIVCAETAEQNKVVLAVGMNRRFVASHALMMLALDEGLLGTVENYDCRYGGIFDWKSATGFYFSKTLAGGGALIDFGVHLLDSLIDWFGPVTSFDYHDDNRGSGIEANAILETQHSGKYGEVRGRLQVSRTFPLPNRVLVNGNEAQAEINISDLDALVVHRILLGQNVSSIMRLPEYPATSSFYKQLDNFVAAIRGTQPPEVDGWRAASVLQLIADCYANAQRIPEPWSDVTETAPRPSEVIV